MSASNYTWQRYWIPRDGGFSFDSQGFLQAPFRDRDWIKYPQTDAVEFEALIATPCLVFLGEPGIGKSYAIKNAMERTKAVRQGSGIKILFRNLNTYSTDALLVEDIFKGPEFARWVSHGGELHLFLDSFDECQLRVDTVAELLAEQLGRVSSVKNLFLRIASRTAEWRPSLEDALQLRWGKQAVGVYELAPLTREQVSEAARMHLSDAEEFVEAVANNEAVPFAIKPLTLDLLIRVWRKHGGSLPGSQHEIYEQGCLELCTESEQRRTPRLRGQLSSQQRLAIGVHIAAATFFCNRPVIWTGASSTQKPESDISVSELAAGFVNVNGQRLSVTESAIREVLNTGLFTARGPNRLGWAHQTYGEFLAARYLSEEKLTVRQSLDLLTHPFGAERKLVPQLQETAAWAALPGTPLFDHVVHVQPEVLLRSDVTTAEASIKSALVEALLAAFANDSVEGDWWALRKRYHKLHYPGLAQQVKRYISNRTLPTVVRVEAISIAEICKLHQLIPLLAKLALDVAEDQEVRRRAAAAVARSSDAKSKKRLRPLALGKGGLDPDDRLRGAGLMACWPEHLTTDELFSSLTEPDNYDLGIYQTFLTDLGSRIAIADLPRALAWVNSLPERDDPRDPGFGQLVLSILNAAADHIEAANILHPLASALISRLRKHDFLHGTPPSRLVALCESRPDIRLTLADSMINCFEDARRDSALMTRQGLRMVSKDDLGWIMSRLRLAQSPRLQNAYSHLINWVFYPDTASEIDAVLETSQAVPILIEAMPHWLKPLVINSDEARKARDCFYEEKRHREIIEKERVNRCLTPSPAEHVVALLDQFEDGNLEAWWKVSCWLEIQDDGNYCEKRHHVDLRELSGWKVATDATKSRMVAAAQQFLFHFGPKHEEWIARENITYFPAVAGFRGLLLLANENTSAYKGMPFEVWRNWTPAILRLQQHDERDEHRLIAAEAFDRAPDEAIEWTIKVINLENKEGENLWILQKLPDKWSANLGIALMRRIRQRKLKPRCIEQLLEALLEHHVSGALSFARSLIPLKRRRASTSQELTLRVSRLLMYNGDPGDWAHLWNLIQQDEGFGRALVEGIAYDCGRSPAGVLKTLKESEIGELWEWMLVRYPISEDPDRNRGGTVTVRYAVANLRDSLVRHLTEMGTAAACEELRRLMGRYTQFDWLRRLLLRAQEQLRRLTWEPLSPDVLYQFATNGRARLVQSGAQLLEVILDSLAFVQDELQGETTLAQFLWDGNRPKREEAISEFVKYQLEKDLNGRGVVLGREVQIHRFDKTDIHVTAVTKDDENEKFGAVKVIVEVKGDWHRELKTAMKSQLVDRYLNNNDCHHGLYLVGWFRRVSRPNPVHTKARADLARHLAIQASALTNLERTVRAFVLDCSLRVPARRNRARRIARKRNQPRPLKRLRMRPRLNRRKR